MSNKDFANKALWSLLMFLVVFLFGLCVLSLGYLFLENTIQEYRSQPTYTKDELMAITKNREKIQRIERANNFDLVENGIHVKTGLKDDVNLGVVISSCTSCHSAKLISQNKATREGWKNMIVWMQATQGLNDLGDNEPLILDYLAKHYAPKEVGRRQNLNVEEIKWYVLNLEE